MNLVVILILCISIIAQVNGSKILFYFGFGTYSHRVAVWPLVEALAERGHEVTFFSTIPPKVPNPKVKEFIPNSALTFFNGKGLQNVNLLHMRLSGQILNGWDKTPAFAANLCQVLMSSEDTKEWVRNSEFDLVIIDPLFNDYAYGLVHKFKAKHILYGTNSFVLWNYEPFGLFPESSWIPDMIRHYPQDMTIWQRIRTTIEPLRWHYNHLWYYFPKVEEIVKKELELTDFPPLQEIHRNASLYFSNAHYSDEYARALPPFVVPVGGLHLQNSSYQDSKALPKEISALIDRVGGEGFVYISFGSEIKISTLPPDLLNPFFEMIQKSKMQFIWKWEDEIPTNAPKNVLFQKWVPQRQILASPKLKAFVAHGGLLGIHEAIYHKVPMVIIPVFAEQDFNGERVSRNGYGHCLEITELTEEKLTKALNSVLLDKKYKDRITEVAAVFTDRQNNPLETAIWYTEFVLRHNDTSFLKPLSINQTWYQRRLLDVWCIIFGFIIAAGILLVLILRKAIHFMCCSKTTPSRRSLNSKSKLKSS